MRNWIRIFFFNLAYPILIAPIFNTFTPLEEGSIRDGIESLITKTGLNCENVFLVDGSRQSKHSNAYVAGFFFSKRIVVYDTLINDLEENVDDINAVVAHEIGHSVMMHNWLLLGSALVNMFLLFFSFGLVQNDEQVVRSFGYSEANSFLTLSIFMALYSGTVAPFFQLRTTR